MSDPDHPLPPKPLTTGDRPPGPASGTEFGDVSGHGRGPDPVAPPAARTAEPILARVEATRTTTRLLDDLADPENEASWAEIDRRYRPIVIGVAHRLGLGEEAAAEIAQATMVSFLTSYRRGGYDRSRGRLRSWIVGICRHRIADHYEDARKRKPVGGDTMLDQLPAGTDFDGLWETERRRVILRRALEELPNRTRLKSSTVQAFSRFAIDRQPVERVAADLGLTVDDVYQAKNRVATKLRSIAADLERRFDEESGTS
ncbi:MAG: RNA polymerase sigma factor [Phycisphaerales bacterium]